MAKAPYSASAQALPHRMSRLFTEIRWILQVALGVFLLMALVSYSRRDPSWTHAAQVDHISNWAGRVGAWTSDILLLLFGLSAYWWIVLLGRHISRNYKRITRHEDVQDDEPRGVSWLADAFAFMLVLLACNGIEALRMWSLKVQLPRAPGGVIGEAVARGVSHALGFTGGTLALLIALAIGLSLYFRFSWLSVSEKVGESIISAVTFAKLRREAGRDRKLGEAAAVKREGKVEKGRVRIEEHEPVMIVPPVVTPAKSERVEKERQVPLFTDLPGDSTLPPISLLDAGARRAGNHLGRYAGIHLAPDREKAQGLRRRRERGRCLSGAGRHALRNRTGHRREGQPDRQSGEGPGAFAVARVDPRGRNDSGQELHGARIAEPAPPDRAPVGDSRLGRSMPTPRRR